MESRIHLCTLKTLSQSVKGIVFLLLLLWGISNGVYAQQKNLCTPSNNKQAEKYYEKAREARADKKPFKTIQELCMKSMAEDSTYAEPLKLLGDVAWMQRQDSIMAIAYAKLIALCPDASSDAHYRLADYYFQEKEYSKAIPLFSSYLDFNKVKEEQAKDAEQKIKKAGLMLKPVPFQPMPLSDISGPDPEYLAIISPDAEFCFFTRRFEEQKRGALFPVSVEKFMVSNRVNGLFQKGEPMPPPFNKAGSNNEGGASITIDNRHLFFTVNKNGNFDIYTSDEANGVWTEPRSVGSSINHPERWESQPSISPDGKTLFFVSIRDSIHQSSDIYVSRKDAEGSWGPMQSIGAPINTQGNEKTPFIHPDNKTLYFSSDFLPGMGGYDIFMCKQQKDGSWSTPVNLGYPINTESDELGFFVSTDGKKGYFASNNLKGKGGYDIYEFDLYEQVRPERVLFIKGELKDEDQTAPAKASIELKNAVTQEKADIVYDSSSGRYASVVAFDQDFILTVKKQGYAYNSAYFSSADSTLQSPRKVDFELKKTQVGGAYRLNNVLFAIQSSELTVQDKNIIRDFAEYLKENPSIKIALHGHTDNAGSPASNLTLSELRAKSVYDFLIAVGVKQERMSYKGFGQDQPVAGNNTAEGRSQNRRTEFVIVSQ